MVARIHRRVGLVAVPELPDGGGSILGHVSPRRIGVVGGQQIGHIGKAVVGQSTQQPTDADDTAGHVSVARGDDVGHHVLHHFILEAVGHDAESQRQEVGRGRVVAVEYAVGV